MSKLMMIAVPALAAALLARGPVWAQTPTLPRVSPSEQMINDANRALRAQELRQQQQNTLQFEFNDLRAQQLRQQQFPRLIGPNSDRNCVRGAPGC